MDKDSRMKRSRIFLSFLILRLCNDYKLIVQIITFRFRISFFFFFFAIQALLSFICSRNIPDITRIVFSCWKKARSKNLESFYSDIDTRNNVASNKVLRTLDNTCKIAFWMEKQESSDQSFEPLRFSGGVSIVFKSRSRRAI